MQPITPQESDRSNGCLCYWSRRGATCEYEIVLSCQANKEELQWLMWYEVHHAVRRTLHEMDLAWGDVAR